MNLIIDIGNTSIKVALFSEGKKKIAERIESGNLDRLLEISSGHTIDRAIISAVGEVPEGLVSNLTNKSISTLLLGPETSVPFVIGYETPETLGMDRLAAVAGAYNFSGGNNVLVIDAGTAITYDVLRDGVYTGGAISPGLGIRFRALNQFTAKLPLVKAEDAVTFPGRNTKSAIATGVVDGLIFEINEYIRRFRKEGVNGMIFLTGGDAEFLSQKIKNDVVIFPELVIEGLNFILDYNA